MTFPSWKGPSLLPPPGEHRIQEAEGPLLTEISPGESRGSVCWQQVGVEGPAFKWKRGLADAHPLSPLSLMLLGRKLLDILQHERRASTLGT